MRQSRIDCLSNKSIFDDSIQCNHMRVHANCRIPFILRPYHLVKVILDKSCTLEDGSIEIARNYVLLEYFE